MKLYGKLPLQGMNRLICFSFFIVNKENDILESKTFAGNNAGDVFIDYLLLAGDRIDPPQTDLLGTKIGYQEKAVNFAGLDPA